MQEKEGSKLKLEDMKDSLRRLEKDGEMWGILNFKKTFFLAH